MAEALLNQLCETDYHAESAGVQKTEVHPLAIKVMGEIDIDISTQSSKLIEQFREIQFDIVVTVCDHARETCPFFPGKKVIHQSFQDPSLTTGSEEQKLQSFRKTRDEIENWILQTFCSQ
jgi:arsenate reductase